MKSWSEISRIELRAHAAHRFREGGGSRPDVLLIEIDSHKAVLKDHNACDGRFGRFIGPLLAWREAKALRRLNGVAGIPRLYARPDRRSVLMEYIPGKHLGSGSERAAGEEFFVRFHNLLQTVHARGVAHCDLRSPRNTLVDEDGRPAIVDFVSCVFRGRRWNIIANWLFNQFQRADLGAEAKLKKLVAPDLLTAEEERSLRGRTVIDRTARWLGGGIRKLSRRLLTKGFD